MKQIAFCVLLAFLAIGALVHPAKSEEKIVWGPWTEVGSTPEKETFLSESTSPKELQCLAIKRKVGDRTFWFARIAGYFEKDKENAVRKSCEDYVKISLIDSQEA